MSVTLCDWGLRAIKVTVILSPRRRSEASKAESRCAFRSATRHPGKCAVLRRSTAASAHGLCAGHAASFPSRSMSAPRLTLPFFLGASGPLSSRFSVPIPIGLIPCCGELIPCWRELKSLMARIDSLFGRAGNFISEAPQTAEFADVFGTVLPSNQRILEEYAVVSLLGRPEDCC